MKSAKLFLAGMVGIAIVSVGCSKYRPAIVEDIFYSGPEFKKGQALVGLQSGSDPAQVLQGYSYKPVDKDLGIYNVSFDSAVLGQVESLQERQGIEFAEPNWVLSVSSPVAAPRDPKWMSLWGLKNYGQNSPGGAEGYEKADIGALEAWAVTKGSQDVIVAVIDTGIDYLHPDLAANMWQNAKELMGVPGVDDDGNGYTDDVYGWSFVKEDKTEPYHGQLGSPDPMDDNDHGTHCAGTIGAVGNNGAGIVGVNWTVRLMALKFLDANGSGATDDAIRAVRYAADNGAQVMSNSWGGGGSSKAMEKAILYAESKGAIFVAAAGNDSANNDEVNSYPANYKVESLVAVAASDNRDRLADFSNYGYKSVHLAAPGVDIMSTVPRDPTERREPYASFSGTSMATPHVAGALALLLAADPSLKGRPKEIKQRLLDSVDVLPNLTPVVSSGGRLNLAKLVTGKSTPNQLIGQSGWTEVPYSVATPRYPTEKVDNTWTISVPDAKAIQIRLASSDYDTTYDKAVLYDENYRRVMDVPTATVDEWLPPILGSQVHLKFSNSVVQVTTTEKREYEYRPPGMDCAQKKYASTYICDVQVVSDEIPNSTSGQIVIDAIRVLK